MNEDVKLRSVVGSESISIELAESVEIFRRTRAILNQTYAALGRIREYGIKDTSASYPLKIIPHEQSTTKKIQIGTRLA